MKRPQIDSAALKARLVPALVGVARAPAWLLAGGLVALYAGLGLLGFALGFF